MCVASEASALISVLGSGAVCEQLAGSAVGLAGATWMLSVSGQEERCPWCLPSSLPCPIQLASVAGT